MEESSRVWKEEPCGNRLRNDEGAIRRWTEFKEIQGAEKRVVDQSDSSLPGMLELLGV